MTVEHEQSGKDGLGLHGKDGGCGKRREEQPGVDGEIGHPERGHS
jgi:hypothetical protein